MNRAAHFLACIATVVSFAFMERPALAQRLNTTKTTLSYSPPSPLFGTPVILTATVTGTPTGVVTFYDGANVLGDAGITTNTANFTTLALTPGVHTLTAYYGGDVANKPSLSAKIPVTVTSSPGSQFNPASDLIPGATPVDVQTADLNRDGKDDIVVVNQGDNSVSVFLGNGDGSFQTPVTYAVGTTPNAAVITDVNGDGIPDIIVANEGISTLSVLIGNGLGTFATAVSVVTLSGPHSLAVADFNGDGRPDLVVTSTNNGSVALHLNSGTTGFFDPFTTYTTLGITKGLTVGDFNGDGFPDVAVANYSATTNYLSILLGNGDGTLRAPVNYTPGLSPVAVAAADFNGDGHLDLAVANRDDNTVSVFLGVGDGTFSASVAYPAGTSPTSVIAVDVNADSKPDLILADNGGSNISLLIDNSNGTFQSATVVGVESGPRSVVAGSFNGDGSVDLAVANQSVNTVSILLGTAPSSLLLTVSPNPAPPGVTVTLNATLTPSTDMGSIEFFDTFQGTKTLLSTVTLSNGFASFSDTSFADGSHTLTAQYNSTVSNAVILLVQQPTSVTLTVTPPTSTLGQPVTFTANVNVITAVGSVTFYDHGTTAVGTATVVNGQAVLTSSILTAGAHSFTAHYNGDNSDQTSTSLAVAQAVSAAPAGGYGAASSSVTTGTDPDAVVMGDFNADGIADLAVANYLSGNVSIFLGNGDGSFRPGVLYAVGANPIAIAIGDFNNDGKSDLVVSNYGATSVSLLSGVGDGSFNTSVFVPAGTQPVGIAVGDFNGDGNQDIAVIESGTSQVSIIPGNGNGTFQNAVNTTISAGGLRAIVVGDFNADGKTDLAVTGTNGVYVLFGNANFTFGNPISYATSSESFALATGDFNGDGKPDLVVVNNVANTISVLLAGTNGAFLTSSNYPVGNSPQAAVVGDFNGDGFLDIAVANEFDGTVSILYGNGQGIFQPAVSYLAGTNPVALAAGSFNGTGQTDLAVVNYTSGTMGIYLALLGSNVSLSVSPNPDPAGVPVTFTATVTPSAATGTVTFIDNGNTVGTAPVINSVATFTASLPAGVQDLTAVYGGDTIYGQSTSNVVSDTVAQAIVTTTLTATPNPSTLNQVVTLSAAISSSNATGLVTFYNGVTVLGTGLVSNGQAQLLTAALPAGSLQLYARYDGDNNNARAISLAVPFTVAAGHGFGLGNATSFATGTTPVSVTAADFNGDGRMDLAVANSAGNTLSVLLGNGDGTFAPGVTLNTGTAPTQVITTDFNGDGKPDLAVSNSVSSNVTVFTGNGDGTFSAGVTYPAGTGASSLVAADFNNDGKADLMVADSSGDSVSFIYGNGDGTLGTTATIPVGVANSFVAAGDFNNDGNTDIAVADTSSNAIWIMLGQGNGQFSAPVRFTAGTTPVSIALGDFNGDGKLDMAVANKASGNVTVLLGNGDGTFQAAVANTTGSGTQYVATGDFNGDGILDLVAVNQAGSVEVLIGNGNGTFQTAVAFAASASPVSLVVNNFNGDGKDQVAVANSTVNSVSVLLDTAATLTASAGNNQFTSVGTSFPSPLQVQATGFGLPIAGVTVNFSVPSSGPSAEFAGTGLTATAVTGSNGIAVSPVLTANGTTGTYSVIASVGSASVTFSLSNRTSTCSFLVSGGTISYDSSGGSTTLTVTANSTNCQWSAATDSGSWVTLSSAGGQGTGSVIVTVAPNTSGAARSGHVFIAGQTFPVTEALTTQVFADVPPSAYYFDAANLLYANGVTNGCGTNPLVYCPTQNVTRAQMAVFIVRAIYGTNTYTVPPVQIFSDVPPGSFGYSQIQELSALGITSGCGVGIFCPNNDVTRAEMSLFLISARLGEHLPFGYPSTPYFTDVPANSFGFAQIQRMKQDQITSGCGPTAYCPNSVITRGDMAIFIMRGLFNQLLPVGTPVISSISPNVLGPGQAATMVITGTNTNFQQGISLVNPLPGVTFSVPTVTSATSLTVQVAVASNALIQPWSIEVVTGTENDVLPSGLNIQ